MIPPVVIPIMFSLVGKGLTEKATEPQWSGALTRRFKNHPNYRNRVRRSHGGKLVRKNPLPVGRYWIDVFDDGYATWNAWLATANLQSDPTSYQLPGIRVSVEKDEYYEPFEGSDGSLQKGRHWILFNVLEATPWGDFYASKIGWPNTAPQSIQTSDDTVQKPDPNDARTDWLPDVGPLGKIAIAGTGILVVAVLAGYAVRSFR